MSNSPKKRNWLDISIGLVIFSLSFAFLLTMHRFVLGGVQSTIGPLFFPRFIITLVVVLSLALVLIGWLNGNSKEQGIQKRADGTLQAATQVSTEESEKTSSKQIVIYLGILFFYLISLNFIGFIISTSITMILVAYLLKGRRLLKGRNLLTFAPGAIGFSIALYYIALKLMKIMLPLGILFE
jgi:hypothetical protein